MTSPTDPILRSARLILRDFDDGDKADFHRLNTDRMVLEFLGPPLTREASDDWVDRIIERSRRDLPRLLAVTDADGATFMGYVGLWSPTFDAHFTPCVEIGWRLAVDFWRKGIATEAARMVLSWGFDHFLLPEIVSFTTVANTRSRAVMERIGMNRVPTDDFDHPRLGSENPLRPHVLYRISSPRAQHPSPARSESESPRAT